MIFLCHAIAKISVSEGVFRKKKLRSQPVTAQFAFFDYPFSTPTKNAVNKRIIERHTPRTLSSV